MIRILHISDLHFAGELRTAGKRKRLLTPPGGEAHDHDKLQALSTRLALLRRKVPLPQFAHLVVTGDVSTDGARESLTTARMFLEEEEIFEARRLISHGLGYGGHTYTIIPGNHDRYRGLRFWQHRHHTFERVFGDLLPPHYPFTQVLRGHDFQIVLFVFDSTRILVSGRERWSLGQIARGQVTDEECRWLFDTADGIATTGMAIDGYPVDPARCVRVAVLHHHPTLCGERHRYLTSMDNADQFVKACQKAGINMVLFGHQHRQYWCSEPSRDETPFGEAGPVHFFCCPTTSQHSATDRGFYIHEVSQDKVIANYYNWDGSGFTNDPTPRPFRFANGTGGAD